MSRGSERVLVVDDDQGTRVVLEAALECYQVRCASSALEAQDMLDAEDFDLVICDVMMPRMTGAELYQTLPEDSPMRERFVFMTGGALSMSTRSFLALVPWRVLEKPFTIAQVRDLVAGRLAATTRDR